MRLVDLAFSVLEGETCCPFLNSFYRIIELLVELNLQPDSFSLSR